MAESSGQVTRLLSQWKNGRPEALERLMPLVYRQLRRVARSHMRHERAGHTLQPTALVHEAFLELAGQDGANWQNRSQFVAVASQIMRRILAHYARKRAALKRGGGMSPEAKDFEPGRDWHPEAILAVDETLRKLERLDSQQVRIVELRWFGGLSVEETAAALGISSRTVKRDWALATHWMRRELAPGSSR